MVEDQSFTACRATQLTRSRQCHRQSRYHFRLRGQSRSSWFGIYNNEHKPDLIIFTQQRFWKLCNCFFPHLVSVYCIVKLIFNNSPESNFSVQCFRKLCIDGNCLSKRINSTRHYAQLISDIKTVFIN